MDQLYFEAGYLEAYYLTVFKEASAGFTPYFAEGYLPIDYFNYEGSSFSLFADLTLQGEDIFASGSLVSTSTINAIVNVTASGQSAITATFTHTATISHIEGADLFAFSNAQLEAAVRRIRDNNITASAVFSVATDATRTRNTASNEEAFWSFTATTVRSRDYASSQSAAFSLAAAIDPRVRDQSSVIASSTSLTATIDNRVRDQSSALVSEFTVASIGRKIRFAHLTGTGVAAVTCLAERTRNVLAVLSATVSQTATANYANGQLNSNAVAVAQINVISTVSVRNTQVSQFNSVSIDTGTKQFGLGSAKFTNAYDSTDAQIARYSLNVLHDGTNFKIFTDLHTWTSSDGLSWTRESSALATTNNVRFANSRYFTHNGSNARYSTNGTTWANEAITNGSGGTVAIVFLNSNFHNIYLTTTSNTRRFRTNKTSAFGSANWITDQEITNTGKTVAQGVTFTQIVDVNNFAVWASEFSGGSNFILRYNGTTTNSYTAPAGGLPEYIGYNGGSEFIYQSTTLTKYSTNTGTSWTDLDIGAGNKLTGNAVYVNSRWFVPTTLGLYSGSSVTALTLADVNANTPVAFGSGRYVAQEKYLNAFFATSFIGNIRYSTDASTWQSLVVPQQDNLSPRLVYSRTGTDLVNFQTIDFWFYNRFVLVVRESSNRFFEISTTDQTQYVFNVYDGVNAPINQSLSGSGLVPQNQWNHARISKDGTNIALYINGTRNMQFTSSITAFTGGTVELFGVTQGGQTVNNFIDEFRITDELLVNPNTSSFTVPTQRFSNTTDTDLLLHFDTDFADDSRYPVDPQAALASVSSVSAILSGPQRLSASLTSSSSLTALGGKLNQIDLVAFSNGALTATILRIKDTTGAFTSASSLSAVVAVVRNTDSAISSEATLTTVGARTRFGVSTQSAEFIQTTVAVKTAEAVSTINALGILTTVGARTRFGVSSQNATFTQSTQGAVARSANSSQSAEFTQNTVTVKTANIVSGLNAQASLTATISHIEGADLVAFTNAAVSTAAVVTRSAASTQTSVATQVTVNARTRSTASAVSCEFTQSAVAVKTVDTNAAFTSAGTVQIISDRIRSNQFTISTSCELTANANKIARVVSTLSVTATVSAVANTNRFAALVTTSSASVVATVVKTASVVASQSSAGTLNTQPNKLTGYASALASQFSIVCVLTNTFEVNLLAFSNGALSATVNAGRSATVASAAQAIVTANTQQSVRKNTGAGISSQFNITTQAGKIVSAEISTTAVASELVVIAKIGGFFINSQVVSTLSVTATRTRGLASAATASSTFTVATTKLVGVIAAISSSATVVVNGTQSIGIIANITSALNFVVEIREFRIDEIVYVIPGETRIYKIASETRIHNIASETRIHII